VHGASTHHGLIGSVISVDCLFFDSLLIVLLLCLMLASNWLKQACPLSQVFVILGSKSRKTIISVNKTNILHSKILFDAS